MATLILFTEKSNKFSEKIEKEIEEVRQQVWEKKMAMIKWYWAVRWFDVIKFDIVKSHDVAASFWINKAPSIIVREGTAIWKIFKWVTNINKVFEELTRLSKIK